VASIVGPFSGPGPRPLSSLHPKRRMGRDPSKPKRIFPSTNFDSSKVSTDASGAETGPLKEDEARKAARFAIHESPILSTPDRTVMTITRGDFLEMGQAGEFPRQRTYMVASDLSPQATYAMEWAIGTVLREGDILYVVQALGKDDEPYEEKDREANCKALAEEVKRLLKRTRLQVKVHIEIVAAKTPKHMITEMVFRVPLSSSAPLLMVLCRLIILILHWLFWVPEGVLLSKTSFWVHSQHTSSQNHRVPSW